MSKKDENGAAPSPDAGRKEGNGNPPQNNAAQQHGCGMFLAVEEHAAALGISSPIFAAVKVAKGWNAGKKVERTEFKKAVDGFLKAPTGGNNAVT
ncbi:MAG: hypothetical protein LBH35_00430 [Treponema sp.]|jgi:hypothetical protein|nr:hypothetical protein [Treponema sp.]